MKHLLEVTRIIDGAMNCDRVKVAAYVDQLARKLRENGESDAADRIERTLRQVETASVKTSEFVARRSLPVDADSRLALADETVVDAANPREHVILEPAVGVRVREFIRFVGAADRLLERNVEVSPSMILFGPPGVGKTQLARYIAGQLALPLITARVDAVISSFLGSTAKNLRLLFEHVKSRPCVLLLDELDSLAKLRDDQHELGELKRVVVSLLQNIDALGTETVLLGATNHEHLLDSAIWRRFTYRLKLELPSESVREQLFDMFLHSNTDQFSTRDFANLADGLTGADIRRVCEQAIRLSIVSQEDEITETSVFREIIRSRLGDTFDFTRSTENNVRDVHELKPKLLTCRRLSELFGTSEATISRRLNAGRRNGKA